MHVLTLEQVCQEAANAQPDLTGTSGTSTQENTFADMMAPTTGLNDVLRHLIKILAQPHSLDQILSSLASVITASMHIDLCVILLMDQAQNQLVVYTSEPDLRNKGVIIEPVAINSLLWEHFRQTMTQGQLPILTSNEQMLLNPLKNVQHTTMLALPLIVGNEYIGLINCYSSRQLYWNGESQLILVTIASQAALAIKHLQHLEAEALTQKNLVKSLFDDLFSHKIDLEESIYRRAYFAGCDLTHPHVVVTMEVTQALPPPEHESERRETGREAEWVAVYKGLLSQLEKRILARYPGSLLSERDTVLVGLLRLDAPHTLDMLISWLDELVCYMRSTQQVYLSVGIGNPCEALADYQRGFAEALEALEIGRFLHQEGGTMQFNALGIYRYIYKFARTDTLHDDYQRQILSIAEYDQRKNAHLLDTLEAYLECGGNATKTYTQLKIHRNTMLQRMERLQSLCTIDLEQHEHWLPLLVALKVYKLRTHHS
jgi:sugar diacid utilization regulator